MCTIVNKLVLKAWRYDHNDKHGYDQNLEVILSNIRLGKAVDVTYTTDAKAREWSGR